MLYILTYVLYNSMSCVDLITLGVLYNGDGSVDEEHEVLKKKLASVLISVLGGRERCKFSDMSKLKLMYPETGKHNISFL